LQRIRAIVFSPIQTLFPEDAIGRLHPVVSRGSSKNERIPILKNKPIRLIKWPKARLEDLLIIPCLKRRIREEAIRNYLKGERQKPPHPLSVAPTTIRSRIIPKGNDYS